MIEKSRHLRVGSMFTGYGGLDMAVLAHFGGTLAWYAEVEPAACRVLEAHHPGVPNLGDVTVVDWHDVAPVDAITAGYPCQPFSHAGKRKGNFDVRHLWPYVRDAIGALGPSHVVLENVAGHLSMGLADVIGDLAGLGYDARWGVVRASDAGAPHQRARVFIVANPNRAGWQQHGGTVADESEHSAAERAGHDAANPSGRSLAGIGAARVGLPEPAERRTEHAAHADGEGSQRHSSGGGEASTGGRGHVESGASFPSDANSKRHGSGQRSRVVGRVGCTSEVSGWQASTARQEPGAGGVADAADAASPRRVRAAQPQDDGSNSGRGRRHDIADVGESGSAHAWGQYEPAIRRWERLTRPAPAPTIAGANGKQRLSPSFVEWMMGLPEGHVTGHGLSNAQALKMLGNGVVPQQARIALGLLA